MWELIAGWAIQAISKIISLSVYMSENPGSHYHCFVDFASAEEAKEAAAAKHEALIGYGGACKVSIAKERRLGKVFREQLTGKGETSDSVFREKELKGDGDV